MLETIGILQFLANLLSRISTSEILQNSILSENGLDITRNYLMLLKMPYLSLAVSIGC